MARNPSALEGLSLLGNSGESLHSTKRPFRQYALHLEVKSAKYVFFRHLENQRTGFCGKVTYLEINT